VKLHRPHTVLVVDDDAAVRNLSLTLLRRCGFRTLEAFDGESGLSTFLRHQHDVDLVLTDVVMPKVSGPQMVDKILEFNPSVKGGVHVRDAEQHVAPMPRKGIACHSQALRC
jgi:CheY-like chemotaxis protein